MKSTDGFQVIKSRRMRWVGYVACMGEGRGAYRVLAGKPDGKVSLERPSVGGKIILRWIFRKGKVGAWTESTCLKIGTGGGLL
jgi:hypothetical protein